MHQERLPVHLDPGDPDISVAAPPALHDVAPLRRKTGGHHIVDLAGHAVEPLGKIISLDLQHAVLALLQAVLQEAGNQICDTHVTIPFPKSLHPTLTLTFFDFRSDVSIPPPVQKSRVDF